MHFDLIGFLIELNRRELVRDLAQERVAVGQAPATEHQRENHDQANDGKDHAHHPDHRRRHRNKRNDPPHNSQDQAHDQQGDEEREHGQYL